MFDTNNFKSMISPPKGWTTKGILLLTYSLNLTMLNEILLANNITDPDPDVVRCAVQRDRRAGSLEETRATRRALLAYYKRCITKVKGNSSFHPKLWAFLFEKDGQEMLRLVISSRNLTRQNMREGAICLEGIPGQPPVQTVKANLAVLDLLEKTFGKEIINYAVYKSIAATDFTPCVREICDNSAEYCFLSNSNQPLQNELQQVDYTQMTAISPFLGADSIQSVCKKDKDNQIVTRRASYRQDIFDTGFDTGDEYGINFYYLKAEQNVSKGGKGDVPETQDETGEEQSLVRFESDEFPLHAKVYAFDNNAGQSWLYLGSANFSNNGLNKNDELMLKITSSTVKFSAALRNALNRDGVIKLSQPYTGDADQFPGPQDFSDLDDIADQVALKEKLSEAIKADTEQDELCKFLSAVCGTGVDPEAPLDTALGVLVKMDEKSSKERLRQLKESGELEDRADEAEAVKSLRKELLALPVPADTDD